MMVSFFRNDKISDGEDFDQRFKLDEMCEVLITRSKQIATYIVHSADQVGLVISQHLRHSCLVIAQTTTQTHNKEELPSTS
jgi:hypothetical protein